MTTHQGPQQVNDERPDAKRSEPEPRGVAVLCSSNTRSKTTVGPAEGWPVGSEATPSHPEAPKKKGGNNHPGGQAPVTGREADRRQPARRAARRFIYSPT
jgi:hypothetical protein